MRLLLFSFTTFYCVADHAILSLQLLFFCSETAELQTVRSFPDPKATVFFGFHLEENGDFICYEVSETILSSVSAFCFMQFHVGRFEIPARSRPSGITNISCQFEVYKLLLS